MPYSVLGAALVALALTLATSPRPPQVFFEPYIIGAQQLLFPTATKPHNIYCQRECRKS